MLKWTSMCELIAFRIHDKKNLKKQNTKHKQI